MKKSIGQIEINERRENKVSFLKSSFENNLMQLII